MPAAQEDPPAVDELLLQAEAHWQQGEHEKALAAYDDAISRLAASVSPSSLITFTSVSAVLALNVA